MPGYLDVVIIVVKKLSWNPEGYFRTALDFPWSVPVGHAVLMLFPATILAAVSLLRRKRVSLRSTSWLFATLATWACASAVPLNEPSSLLLAAGLGRPISHAVVVHGLHPRRVRFSLAVDLRGTLCPGGASPRAASGG